MEKFYDHKNLEPKWQKEWDDKKVFAAQDMSKKPKYYCLIEFPYPSGDGLHVGHVESHTAIDIVARKKRMEGFNVLYPIGWDAFGLPTENYAIKTKQHPRVVTEQNVNRFREQIKSTGMSFDWSREVNTTDPDYFKWTQWIFLQLYKNDLAYKDKIPINWCPSCKIGLANEEVIDGNCERCGASTDRREIEQWMLKITKYADRLISDLDTVDYLPRIREQQINWIGRSEGADITFTIKNTKEELKVFTTRPDTLYGATYMVVAPEHELIHKLEERVENIKEVKDYVTKANKKSDLERQENKEKTGVEIKGIKAINPVNNEEIPIYVADYVLISYGSGAIMAVPAHDERDNEFAKKFGIEIRKVITPFLKKEVKEDKPTKERHVVYSVVKNPKTNQILCQDWLKTGWKSVPTGGVEKGEDVVEAARREVLEETGYKNIKFIKKIGEPFYQNFWRPHKGSNVFGKFEAVYFELENEEHEEIEKEEKEQHVPVWIDEDKVKDFFNVSGPEYVWKMYMGDEELLVDSGININSEEFDGLRSEEAKEKITKKAGGKMAVQYKLRDWVFSRQHYWGEPIPIVYCEKCGEVAVPEKDLPIELPDVENYEPTDTGESPLAAIESWVNTKCPDCGGEAKRETDTMPNWAGSSWYYLRYIDPTNKKELGDKKKLKYWTPVDLYNGGMEHTTLHLLYSRFWHKFLFDIGVVPTAEPYAKRISHGMILAEDGQKMSKSLGNVINPDEVVKEYGADTMRLYEMFMGPYEDAKPWSTKGIIGVRRFLEKLWLVSAEWIENKKPEDESEELNRQFHKTIKKVTEDINNFKFNTAISAMMILVNQMAKEKKFKKENLEKLLIILSCFAPHISEEIWENIGNKELVSITSWPTWDENKCQDDEVEIAVQVNGKVRGKITIASDSDEESIFEKALAEENVKRHLEGKEVVKKIYIPGRLVSIVIK